MASIYQKQGSNILWIRYRDENGKWKGKPTGYKADNIGDQRQAKLLARKQSDLEKTNNVKRGPEMAEWVVPWIILKYGNTSTAEAYKRSWRSISRYLDLAQIQYANQITRDFAARYLAWRTGEDEDASRNTAIQEIKIVGMILEEALAAGHCATNPLRKLGLKKERSPGKEVWTDEQIIAVARHLDATRCHWQEVSFYFGLYQACRLRQCQVPLSCIRLDLATITYPGVIVKGGDSFTQPIDPRFIPILERLITTARRMGLKTICEIKWDASLIWRTTLDRVGYEEICHHGLRATWITRAAETGIAESQAMAFCHHSSAEVHRVYKKISVKSIAHVPSAMPLPAFAVPRPAGRISDVSPARPDNEPDASTSQTPSRTRDRARNRRKFATGSPLKTPPVPPSATA